MLVLIEIDEPTYMVHVHVEGDYVPREGWDFQLSKELNNELPEWLQEGLANWLATPEAYLKCQEEFEEELIRRAEDAV